MAARKPADIACMFCGDFPCTCEGTTKKKTPAKKKLVETVSVNLAPKSAQQEPQPVRANLSTVAATGRREAEEARLACEESEREALTALFKAGFMMERVGDPRGFESVRPMLNMPAIDIDIAIWKMRRQQCQSRASN